MISPSSIAVIGFALASTIVFKTTDYNVMNVLTPITLTAVMLILSQALLQKFLTTVVLGKQRATCSALPDESVAISKERLKGQTICSEAESNTVSDRYEALLSESLRKEQKRRENTLRAVNEYVTLVTAGFLSKKSLTTLLDNISHMAAGCTEPYQPLSSDMEKKLKSPDLRHLAWNIGERLGVSRRERAKFIQASFPYELKNATLEYLELNLRDLVPAQIKIDVPDKGDYRFHYSAEDAA